MNVKTILGLLLVVAPILWCNAQVSSGGTPISFSQSFTKVASTAEWTFEAIPALDIPKLIKEDESRQIDRFAAPIAVDFGLQNAGQWFELPNGGRVWQLALEASGAAGLAIFFDQFELPAGAQLFHFTPDRKQVFGAYTQQNNRPSQQFWTGISAGKQAIIEYYEPRAVRGQGRLHINRVDQVYAEVSMEFGFGTAANCNNNINCPEGSDWQAEKKGVSRVIVVLEEGMGFCSASMINNTANDGTPYALGAFHCQDGFTPLYDMWRFDFGYEGDGCANPAEEPGFQSLLGAVRRAGLRDSDFLLLELTEPIPFSYDLYFNGWNRADARQDSAVLIHHASGDVKKISFEYDGAEIFTGNISWDNETVTPRRYHFELFLDDGIHQGGSSGCPVFDMEKRIVAQLHGGTPDCTFPQTFCGRLFQSWTGNNTAESRLSDWLDPLGTGVITLDGLSFPAEVQGLIGGTLSLEDGTPIPGSLVTYESSPSGSVTSAQDGSYAITGVATGSDVSITIQRSDQASNGVSVLDLLAIQKHILTVELLDSPYAIIAGDVDSSGDISISDLLQMRRVILGLEGAFPNTPQWRFLPADYSFSNPNQPLGESLPFSTTITNFSGSTTDNHFIGIKAGDVTGDVILNP